MIKLSLVKCNTYGRCGGRQLGVLWASTAMASRVAHSHSHAIDASKAEKLRLTSLPNGLIVGSLENYSPISRIAVFVRAGARYEPSDQLGLTHTLRSVSGLSTKRSTNFGITRNLEYVGARLSTFSTRDYLIYVLEDNRDNVAKNVEYLADVVMESAFKPWEVSDNIPRQKVDLALLTETPQLSLLEALHRVSFRGGLSNSLFTPPFMLGKHSHETLVKYVEQHFVANRSAIVAFGVEHDKLLDLVEKRFSMARGDRGQSGQSKYVGGEIRIDSDSDITHVAVVAEGVGSKNIKDTIALSLFQTLLGTGTRIKYNIGKSTKLGSAVAKVTENPFAISSLNISYSDLGLFGFSLAANCDDIHKCVKAAVTQLRESAKNITDKDLQIAKNSLKSSILMATESQLALLEEFGTQVLTTGQFIYTEKEIENAINSVSVQDVSTIAQRIIKGKGSMASIGRLHNTPYLEDLV